MIDSIQVHEGDGVAREVTEAEIAAQQKESARRETLVNRLCELYDLTIREDSHDSTQKYLSRKHLHTIFSAVRKDGFLEDLLKVGEVITTKVRVHNQANTLLQGVSAARKEAAIPWYRFKKTSQGYSDSRNATIAVLSCVSAAGCFISSGYLCDQLLSISCGGMNVLPIFLAVFYVLFGIATMMMNMAD